MQTLFTEGQDGTGATSPEGAEGIFSSPHEMKLVRKDWASPVAYFSALSCTRRETQVDDHLLVWSDVRIPELWLSHKATVMLLQGMSLSRVLIPSELSPRVGWDGRRQAPSLGHLILRVDPWEYWHGRPRLTNLMAAKLGEIPEHLSPASVLAALAEASAA